MNASTFICLAQELGTRRRTLRLRIIHPQPGTFVLLTIKPEPLLLQQVAPRQEAGRRPVANKWSRGFDSHGVHDGPDGRDRRRMTMKNRQMNERAMDSLLDHLEENDGNDRRFEELPGEHPTEVRAEVRSAVGVR